MRNVKTSWLLAGVSSLAVLAPAPVLAQTADDATAVDEAAEIVITGSRITRRDYNSESPIATLSADTITSTGAVTLDAAVNRMTQFTPSFGAASTFPNRGGQANLNLRGLGTNRALVLLDGRRIIPSNPDGSVDVNLIPNLLVGRVETITGGASATYGSDAMAGVVNFTLRNDFDGLQVDAQVGVTDQGDGATRDFGVAWGSDFADGRGNVMLFAGRSARDEVLTGDRTFPRNRLMLAYQPTGDMRSLANPPSQAAVNALFASYGYASPGTVTVFGINPDGTLYNQAPTTAPVVNYRGELDQYFLNRGNQIALAASSTYSLQIPLERTNVFGRVTYELTDDVELFADALYTSYNAPASQTFPLVGAVGQSVTAPVTNPFITPDMATLLASRPNPNGRFNLTTALTSLGVVEYDSSWDVGQITTGLRGDLRDGWSWDAHVSYGRVENEDRRNNVGSMTMIQAFLDAPGGGALATDPVQCAGGFNPFGQQISDACAAAIRRVGVTELTLEQFAAEANVQGELFSLPAGAAQFAAGVGYRENSYDFRPDAAMQSGSLTGQNATRPSSGSIGVTEIYGELLLPILENLPLAQEVTVNLGYRYSDYDTSGGVSTYKANFEWETIDSLRFRGGYSRAVRAPSLSELYAAATPASFVIGIASATTTAGDPCDVRSSFRQGANGAAVRDICIAQGVPSAIVDNFTASQTTAFGVTSGNRSLDPETADTYTLGAVFSSPWDSPLLSRLQASVDYFDISIEDAIGQLSLATSAPLCFNSTGSSNPTYDPNNFYCQYIGRDGNGGINGVAPMLNLGALQSDGVDFQIDWAAGLDAFGLNPNWGEVSVNASVTYLNSLQIQVIETQPFLEYAGSTGGTTNNVSPEWRSAVTLNYNVDDLGLGLRWRRIGEAQDVSRVTSATSTVPGVPAVEYFDLFGRYRINDTVELRAGVNNVADQDLPQVGSVPGNSDFSTYDPMGRSYYIGLRASF